MPAPHAALIAGPCFNSDNKICATAYTPTEKNLIFVALASANNMAMANAVTVSVTKTSADSETLTLRSGRKMLVDVSGMISTVNAAQASSDGKAVRMVLEKLDTAVGLAAPQADPCSKCCATRICKA